MPLLKKKPYSLRKALPSGLDLEEALYVVGCTGETFREYEDYLEKVKLYKSRIWSCAYTGKSTLTYEEALEEEAKATSLLSKFPEAYQERVIRSVHHSSSRLEEIVNRVYEDLRPEESSDKENSTKKSARHPIPRSVLRRWIQEYAKEIHVDELRIWVASPELMKLYGLSTIVPLEKVRATKKLNSKKKQAVSASHMPPDIAQPRDPQKGCAHLPEILEKRKLLADAARPGGLSHTAFLALRELGPEGGRVEDIVRLSMKQGSAIDWNSKKKRALSSALCHSTSLFSRVRNGVYALRMYTDCKPHCSAEMADEFSQAATSCFAQRMPNAYICPPKRESLLDQPAKSPGHLQEAVADLQQAKAAAQVVQSQVQTLLAQLHALDEQIEQKDQGADVQGSENGATKMPSVSCKLLKSRNGIKLELRNVTLKLTQLENDVERARAEVARKQVDVLTNGISRPPTLQEMKLDREEIRKKQKEQKRLEALEAKRYPIDDLLLLEERLSRPLLPGESTKDADVFQPSRLSSEETLRISGLLYVSEFLSHFGRSLGLKPLSFQELSSMVNAGSNPEVLLPKNQPPNHVGEIYEKLLNILLDEATVDGRGSRVQQRWYYVLGPGTWPEVLRRYILSSAYAKNLEVVTAAANDLSTVPVNEISSEYHLELLEYLCDEVLTSEEIRNMIQKKIDTIDTLNRDMRTELAEGKQKLRELLDTQKEEKKRKREEQAALVQASPDNAGSNLASVNGAFLNATEDPDNKKIRLTDYFTAANNPSSEPPQMLAEQTEDKNTGRKSHSGRQMELAKKKKLERAQRFLEAEERKKHRVLELEEKTRKQEEAQMQRDIKHAEEDLTRVQEVYEKQIRMQAIRSDPLGIDRYFRNYWWGLGSHKSAIFVEDSAGSWGCLENLDQVQEFQSSLDAQGIRESQLLEAIDKRFKRIEKAMKPTTKNNESGTKNPARKEFPKRTSRHVPTGENPNKHSLQPFGNIDSEAIVMIKESLNEIYGCRISQLIDGPRGGWSSWHSNLKKIILQLSNEKSGETRQALVRNILELEGLLVAGTGESDKYQDEDASENSEDQADDSDMDEDSNIESIAGDSASECHSDLSERKNDTNLRTLESVYNQQKFPTVEEYLESEDDYSTPSYCVWNGAKERRSWQKDMLSAKLLSHVAYSVLSLAESAVPAMKDYQKIHAGRKAKK